MMCIVDTSGSMDSSYGTSVKPIDVAISLGMYCAERIGEPFKNYFISFSREPRLIKVEGIDFCDKVERIYKQNLCQDTNLKAVFDMLLNMYKSGNVNAEDVPEQLIVISDMEINRGSYWRNDTQRFTEMELIRQQWERAGVKMPHLVYWNVSARQNIILDEAEGLNTTFVSGCSPVIFDALMQGKSSKELMLEKLNSERYTNVK